MNGPNDPAPSSSSRAASVDRASTGGREDEFDVLDHFVVRHGLDLDVAAEAAELADDEIARRLVDVDVPREELVRLSRGPDAGAARPRGRARSSRSS